MLIGSLVNSIAIIVGTFIGILFKKGIPERFQDSIQKGLALCIFAIGVTGLNSEASTLIATISIVVGVIIGELLKLEEKFDSLGDKLQRLSKDSKQQDLKTGFINATLLFCIGAMAIMGSLNDGLYGDHSTLFTKALLDGVTSVIFASSMGVGVAISSIPVFIYQGLIAVCASLVAPYLTTSLSDISFVGSLLIIAISFNLLKLTNFKLINFIPSIFIPIIIHLFL